MNIGQLRESILWYRDQKTLDDIGGFTLALVYKDHLWAAINKRSYKYGEIADQESSKDILNIRIRIPEDKLQIGDKIKFETGYYKDTWYEVESFIADDLYNYLDIQLHAVTPNRNMTIAS